MPFPIALLARVAISAAIRSRASVQAKGSGGISVDITSPNMTAVARKIDRLGIYLGNTGPANKAVAIQLYAWAIRNFDGEGSAFGGWEPLAESTLRRKQRSGKEKMLVNTGRLRNSIRTFYDKTNAGIGSNVTYSVFHEEGTPRIPRRPILPTREIVSEIGLRVYQDFVNRGMRK